MSKNTRKNEAKTDISLFNFIKENRLYSNEWNVRKQTNEYIQEILDKTSKKKTRRNVYPNFIFIKKKKKIFFFFLEKISNDISRSSSEINRLLRNLDSQKRPILLSALMICLYPKDSGADFKNSYSSWNTQTIIRNILTTISDILESEKIDKSKIEVLTNELTFIKTDTDLTSTDILKDILKELEERVIPLFDKKTSYDIIGKFYEEFLRYAGTPNHITTLFTELIDIKTNDVIFDPACGTGAFLIAGMNKLISEIEKSNLPDKNQRIKNIKTKQLIGFEKSSTMYSLAISNMLFRGDGKSQIFNEDFFSTNASDVLDKLQNKPTIGFVNPPYGGKDNETNPTKKEIQFLEKMLDSCSRYGIIIAPLSTYFKDDVDRNRILAKHTLKYVINKWNNIKKELLKKITNPKENEVLINLVYKEITGNDEWIIQAHSKTNYKNLSEKVFEKSIKEYVIFSTKLKLNLIDKDIDEITLLEILNENNVSAKNILNNYGEDYENK